MFNQQILKTRQYNHLQLLLLKLDCAYLEIKVIESIAPLSDAIVTIDQSSPEGKLMIDILRKKYQKELDQLKKEIDQ